MNGQVTGVHAQTERDGVQFSEFDTPAYNFLDRCDDSAADQLLERIGGDVPGEGGECDQAKNTKRPLD